MNHLHALLAKFGPLLTITEVARALGWQPEDAEQLLREGELEFSVVDDGVYVRREDLEGFLAKRRHFRRPKPFVARRRVGLRPIGDVVVLDAWANGNTPLSGVI